MAELVSIDKLIRAAAEEFGHCPGWTQLLAESLTELYLTRSKPPTQLQPQRSHMSQPTSTTGIPLTPTLESLSERLLDLEKFVLEWLGKTAALQAETLAMATDANKTARMLLDFMKSQQDDNQQQVM